MHNELRKAQDRLFWRVGFLLLIASIAGVVLAFTNLVPDNPLKNYKWLTVIYFISMASMVGQAYYKKRKQKK